MNIIKKKKKKEKISWKHLTEVIMGFIPQKRGALQFSKIRGFFYNFQKFRGQFVLQKVQGSSCDVIYIEELLVTLDFHFTWFDKCIYI